MGAGIVGEEEGLYAVEDALQLCRAWVDGEGEADSLGATLCKSGALDKHARRSLAELSASGTNSGAPPSGPGTAWWRRTCDWGYARGGVLRHASLWNPRLLCLFIAAGLEGGRRGLC